MKLAERFLEISLTVLIVYYLAVHARGISMVITAGASAYSGILKTLQGR